MVHSAPDGSLLANYLDLKAGVSAVPRSMDRFEFHTYDRSTALRLRRPLRWTLTRFCQSTWQNWCATSLRLRTREQVLTLVNVNGWLVNGAPPPHGPCDPYYQSHGSVMGLSMVGQPALWVDKSCISGFINCCHSTWPLPHMRLLAIQCGNRRSVHTAGKCTMSVVLCHHRSPHSARH